MVMTGYNITCDCESINENDENCITEMPNCNVSIRISNLKPTSCTPQDCESMEKSTLCIPAECGCIENTTPEVTSAAMNNKHSTSNFSNSAVVAALGALVGLLLVLLATVSAVLAWTCWLLKKRNGIKFNTEYQLRYVRVHVRN